MQEICWRIQTDREWMSFIRSPLKIFLLEMIIYLGFVVLTEVQVCEIPAITNKFSCACDYMHISPAIWLWELEQCPKAWMNWELSLYHSGRFQGLEGDVKSSQLPASRGLENVYRKRCRSYYRNSSLNLAMWGWQRVLLLAFFFTHCSTSHQNGRARLEKGKFQLPIRPW